MQLQKMRDHYKGRELHEEFQKIEEVFPEEQKNQTAALVESLAGQGGQQSASKKVKFQLEDPGQPSQAASFGLVDPAANPEIFDPVISAPPQAV